MRVYTKIFEKFDVCFKFKSHFNDCLCLNCLQHNIKISF